MAQARLAAERAIEQGTHAILLVGEDAASLAHSLATQCAGAASNIFIEQGATFKIETVRSWIRLASLAPSSGRRVFVVEGADRMRPVTANALLRLLEEPPKGALFLLTASGSSGVLPTIRSRCLLLVAHRPLKPEPQEVPDLVTDGSAGPAPLQIAERFETGALEFVDGLALAVAARIGEPGMARAFLSIEEARRRLLANGSRRLVLEVLVMDLEEAGALTALAGKDARHG